MSCKIMVDTQEIFFLIIDQIIKFVGVQHMDNSVSNNIKNNVRVASAISTVIIHLWLTMVTLGLWLIILLIVGLITNSFLKREIRDASSSSNKFKRNFPFKYFGTEIGEFEHVFSHNEMLKDKVHKSIEANLNLKTPIKALDEIMITDVDKNLTTSEDRNFFRGTVPPTIRGTTLSLVINYSHFGKMQSIQWRVLAAGFIDNNKKFLFIAFSPLSFLFWIRPYLRGEYDLLNKVRTIHSGSYNHMDLITQVKSVHEVVFDAMINELEKNGIDTSDLKTQKLQIMNINVSGKKVKMGNIVQGAMNNVTNASRAKKS